MSTKHEKIKKKFSIPNTPEESNALSFCVQKQVSINEQKVHK